MIPPQNPVEMLFSDSGLIREKEREKKLSLTSPPTLRVVRVS